MKLIVYSAILLGLIGLGVYAIAPSTTARDASPTREEMNLAPNPAPTGSLDEYGDTITTRKSATKQAQESRHTPTPEEIKKMTKPAQSRPEY